MANDFNEFRRQYIDYIYDMEMEKDSVCQEYEEQLFNDQSLNPILRKIKKLLGIPLALMPPKQLDYSEYDEHPNLSIAEVGQEFAIQYGDITSSISGLSIEKGTYDFEDRRGVPGEKRIRVDGVGLDTKSILGDISDLWTVVKYLGNGQYVDLVTDEIFVVPKNKDTLLDIAIQSEDLVTDENALLNPILQHIEKEASEEQEALIQYPLGIKAMEITIGDAVYRDYEAVRLYEELLTDELFPYLQSLIHEEEILQETFPRQEEIKEKLRDLRQAAIVGIKQFFNKRKSDILKQYSEAATKASRKMRQEEKELQEKMAELERQRRIEEEFDRVFSPRRELASAKIYSLK